jgi:hypothetical protein
MSTRIVPSGSRNAYECALERNQNGKYCVRIRASFGRSRWSLPLYFLASSFDGAMKKLEHTLQYLQKREEALWFWGVQRSDDPNLAAELLADVGLRLDRRSEFRRADRSPAANPGGYAVARACRQRLALRFDGPNTLEVFLDMSWVSSGLRLDVVVCGVSGAVARTRGRALRPCQRAHR